jgi:glycerol-3-phosphate acyltransferase PlsY
MAFLLLVLIGYLVGSIPCSYLSMRLFTGRDIRALGTGQATVTAVAMHGGRFAATAALLGEILKGVACVFIANALVGENWAILVILIAAVVGCSWSVWLRGGGGQGLTIAMSGLVLMNVLAVLIMAVLYLVPLVTTKRRIMSNRLFRLSLPIVLVSWYGSWEYFLAGSFLVLPSFIKEMSKGDDVVVARGAQGVGHNGVGAA